jgi:hypothetical protein
MGESAVDWLARAQDGVTIFLGVVIEATPFLVLGVLVSLCLLLIPSSPSSNPPP